VIEGIDLPRSVISGSIARAQRDGLLARDLSADAVARTLVATFQGFVLQAVWGQPIDVEACIAVIERMLDGLVTKDASPKRRKRES